MDLSTQALKSNDDTFFMLLLINHILLISKNLLKNEAELEY